MQMSELFKPPELAIRNTAEFQENLSPPKKFLFWFA